MQMHTLVFVTFVLCYQFQILFLGCGDLRNPLQATSLTKESHFKILDIHLNDLNASVMARNIVMLKILSASDFNPYDQEDLSFLWDVWYNAEWPEITRKRFKEALKQLLDGSMPENVVMTNFNQFQILREVWTSWYSSIATNDHSELELFMKKIRNER